MTVWEIDPDFSVFLCLVSPSPHPAQSLENAVRGFCDIINYAGTSNEWSCDLGCLLESLIN